MIDQAMTIASRRRTAAAPTLAVLLALVLGVFLSACGGTESQSSATTTGVVHRYVIPLGTGEAIDRGEPVDVMPNRLEIAVGDAVEIVNEDDRGHNVGLFFVGEGETVSQVFPSVAEFTDVCSVSSSGEFTISVT